MSDDTQKIKAPCGSNGTKKKGRKKKAGLTTII